MNLTEGQLFTIEALNRIEGFVWPEKAEYAAMDAKDGDVSFYKHKPDLEDEYFSVIVGYLGFNAGTNKANPDWRNSLITREQFDSVNGWVRNDGNKPVISGDFDLLLADGEAIYFSDISVDRWDWAVPCKGGVAITHWRYHKPTKESEMKDAEQFQPPIHETYYRYKKQRENTADARKALEASMEAEDKLLEQIKAWNLEYGFDIRVLDESDEVPEVESELVITDWRDLRVGDVVWWSGAGCIDSGEYVVSNVESNDYKGSTAFCVSCAHGLEWVSTKFEKWKFIRRHPSN